MCLDLRGDSSAVGDKYSILDSPALLATMMLCKMGTEKWPDLASGVSSLALRSFSGWMVAEDGLEPLKEQKLSSDVNAVSIELCWREI